MWKPWQIQHNQNRPDKPEDKDEQLSMIWDAVYNHIPSWLSFIEIRFNYVWILFGIVLALLGCLIAVKIVS